MIGNSKCGARLMVCHLELVVDAGTGDVVDEVAVCNDKWPTGDGDIVSTAEVDVEIFELGGPIIEKRPFDSAADRPAVHTVRGVECGAGDQTTGI